MYGETKQGRVRRLAGLGAVALAAVAVTGCAHNDVLVFGTSTTIGLNVETASSQGAAPSIVLGYEREEAVWMPLLVNGIETRVALCPKDADGSCDTSGRRYPIDQAMYRSQSTDSAGRQTRDAYSVFASLGASFNGRGNATEGAAAGGGLAQFFATGNAALNISSNEALVTALKVESGAGAEAQARAVAAATGAAGFDALAASNMTEAERRGVETWLASTRGVEAARLNRINLCARDSTGTWRWPTILTDMTVSSTFTAADKDSLAVVGDEEALRAALLTETTWQIEAERAAKAKGYC
jgi:hypothetical protein